MKLVSFVNHNFIHSLGFLFLNYHYSVSFINIVSSQQSHCVSSCVASDVTKAILSWKQQELHTPNSTV